MTCPKCEQPPVARQVLRLDETEGGLSMFLLNQCRCGYVYETKREFILKREFITVIDAVAAPYEREEKKNDSNENSTT